MKHLMLVTAAGLAAVAALHGAASAQVLTSSRCQNAFNTTSDTAQRRYAWALWCRGNAAALSRNPEHFLAQLSIDDYNATSPTTPTPERPYLRSQLFPTYLDFQTFAYWDIPNTALGTAADPTLPPTTTAVCNALATYQVNAGLCVAGCYVEGTALQFADGPMGIKAAAQSNKADIVTLSPDATRDNLAFAKNKVERYVTDVEEAVQVIHTLKMASGGQLRVTSEHPLLDDEGMIRQAQALKVGDRLVRADGKADPIVSVRVDKELTKVWNVQPVSTDYVSNLLVAGGYVNGSLRYQNEFLSVINSLILRRSLGEQSDKLTN